MKNMNKAIIPYINTIILGTTAIFIAAAIVTFPDIALNASIQGLKIWWDIIFPALLPFFITAEILLGFGIVSFLGVLLEPLMKPIFNVPGAGAFVLAMGFASGYPMGAKLTSRLREQNMLSRVEGERLVAFTSTSDPLFLFGAIAVGFFHDVKLGVFIALVHYSSSILVGLIMRYYQKGSQTKKESRATNVKHQNILIRAFQSMHHARITDGRKFGKMMGDAVMTSTETLMMIGGFIIVFSVILAIITKLKITLALASLIKLLLIPLGLSGELSQSIIYGLFEVTLGAKSISEAASTIPLAQKIAVLGFISAWSGISVHAQVAAILQKTDIKYLPFFFARIAHGLIALFASLLLWNPLNISNTLLDLPVFLDNLQKNNLTFSLWDVFVILSVLIVGILTLLLVLSLTIHFFHRKKA